MTLAALMQEAICNNRPMWWVSCLCLLEGACTYYRALHTGRKRFVAGTHADSVSIIQFELKCTCARTNFNLDFQCAHARTNFVNPQI